MAALAVRARRMAWWKQIVLVLVLVAGALVAWALFVPGAAPVLARLGLPAAPAADVAAPAAPGRSGGPGRSDAPTLVVAAEVLEAATGDRLLAIGDGRALRSVAVTPLSAGRVVDVAVTSGQRVASGDLIALLDDEAEAIGVARGELAVEDAEATLSRLDRLRGTGATTEVQLREARLALERARLELRDATLALERRRVVAPFDGVIGIIAVEPGQQVTTASEIATLDDRMRILVDFRVPERWVGALKIGDRLEATPLSRPALALEAEVHALDNRIDQASRTLRVQAIIDNDGDLLRAGMAFRIATAFAGEVHPAVDPLAIQWSSDGAFVWVVRDERAVRVTVRIVQRGSERVLISGALAPGERVVVEGVQRLREGMAVAVEDDRPGAGDAAGPDLSRAGPGIRDS
jgi:RND family efflux transporter MFP subunit